MATRTTPTMTAEEFFDWANRPENEGKRWELVRGQPTELPRWPDEFAATHLHIASILTRYVLGRRIGSVAIRGDGLITATKPDTIRCPAVMVFFDPPPKDDFPPRFTTEIPQLVVELHAPGESYGQIIRRMIDYVEFGVPLIWGVEPDTGGVSVYEPKRPPYVPEDDEELTGYRSLPYFSCRVRDLFTIPVPESQPPPKPRSRSRKGTRE